MQAAFAAFAVEAGVFGGHAFFEWFGGVPVADADVAFGDERVLGEAC